jgi:hypothetical protein
MNPPLSLATTTLSKTARPVKKTPPQNDTKAQRGLCVSATPLLERTIPQRVQISVVSIPLRPRDGSATGGALFRGCAVKYQRAAP